MLFILTDKFDTCLYDRGGCDFKCQDLLQYFIKIFGIGPQKDNAFLVHDVKILEDLIAHSIDKEAIKSISLVCGAKDYLYFKTEDLPIEICLRKLFSYGFFAKLFKEEQRIEIITDINAIIFRSITEALPIAPYSVPIIAFALASISHYYKTVDIKQNEASIYKELIKTSLNFYLTKGFITTNSQCSECVFPYFLRYFQGTLFSFKLNDAIDNEYIDLFNRILQYVISTISIPMNYMCDYEPLTEHLLKLLSSDGSNYLPISTRTEIFLLITTICDRNQDIAISIFDPGKKLPIISFIFDLMRCVNFDPIPKEENPEPLKVTNIECSKVMFGPCFKDKIKFSDSLNDLTNADKTNPEPPELSKRKELIVVIQHIKKFAEAIKFQVKEITHMKLIAGVIERMKSETLPQYPFLITSWLRVFERKDIDSLIVDFYEIGFYEKLIEMIFVDFPEESLIDYYVKLFIVMTANCKGEPLHLITLFKFFNKSALTMRINPKLSECLEKCLLEKKEFMKKILLPSDVSDLLMGMKVLRKYHQENPDSEECARTRTQVFHLINVITSTKDGLSAMWESEFPLPIVELILDESTAEFASILMQRILCEPSTIKKTLQKLLKFIDSYVLSNNVSIFIHELALKAIINGLMTNETKLSQIMFQLQFFAHLLTFIQANKERELVKHLIAIARNTNIWTLNDDTLLSISHLIDLDNQEALLMYAFGSNQPINDTLNNQMKIVNTSPFCVLVRMKSHDENDLLKYIEFLLKVAKSSFDNRYLLSSSQLNSEIIKVMKRYWQADEITPVFKTCLDFFEYTACASIKSHDLIALFQLFRSTHEKKRPIYNVELMFTLQHIFVNDLNLPNAFFHFNGSNTRMSLTSSITHEMVYKGFTLFYDLKINTYRQGYLFYFSSSEGGLYLKLSTKASPSTLVFENWTNSNSKRKTTIITKEPQTYLSPNFGWTRIAVVFDGSHIKVYRRGTQMVNAKVALLNMKEDFNTNSFVDSIDCEVSKLTMIKKPLSDQMVKLMLDFNPQTDVSFQKAESKFFDPDSDFQKLFEPSFVENIYFLFSSSVMLNSTKAQSMVSSQTMTIHGMVHHGSPPPISIFNTIGGASILLPLFAQIEQPVHGGNQNDDYCITAIRILHFVLQQSDDMQELFYRKNGFKILGYLLSLVGPDKINDYVIAELFALYDGVTHTELLLQLVRNVFLEFSIWLYLTPKQVVLFYNTLFQKIEKNPMFFSTISISNLLSLISMYLWIKPNSNSLLVDKKHVVGVKNKDISRTENIPEIRKIFFQAALDISIVQLSKSDILTLLYFCTNREDEYMIKDCLELTLELLRSQNTFFIEYIKSRNILPDLFQLFNLDNCNIHALAVKVFVYVCRLGTSDKTIEEWIFQVLSSVNITDSDNSFAIFFSAMLEPDMDTDVLLPLVLQFLLHSSSSNSNFEFIYDFLQNEQETIKDNFSKYEKPLLLYLMVVLYSTPSEESTSYGSAQMVIIFLSSIYSANLEALNRLRYFFEFMTARTGKSYSHILTEIYKFTLREANLHKPLKKLSDTIESQNYQKQYTQLFNNIYCHMYHLSSYDPYYELETSRNNTQISFYDLYKASLSRDPLPKINYVYATRTKPNLEWEDFQLAESLMELINDHHLLLSIDAEPYSPVEILTSILVSDVNHKYDDGTLMKKYLKFVRPVMKEYSSSKGFVSNSFFLLEGNFARMIQRGAKDNFVYELIFQLLLENKSAMSKLPGKQPDSATKLELAAYIKTPNGEKWIDSLVRKLFEVEMDYSKKVEVGSSQIYWVINNMVQNMTPFEFNLMIYAANKRFDYVIAGLQEFNMQLKSNRSKAAKIYRDLFNTLSGSGCPWADESNPEELHWMMQNSIYPGGKRSRMKQNHNFTNHKDASMARDVGSVQKAQEEFHKEMIRQKENDFKGDYVLFDDDDENEGSEKEVIDKQQQTDHEDSLLKLEATCVMPSATHRGHLFVYEDHMQFDSPTKFIKIYLLNIKEVLFRRYLLFDTALEIFTNIKKAYFFNFPEGQRSVLIKRLKNLNNTWSIINKKNRLPNLKFLQESHKDIFKLVKLAEDKWRSGKLSNYQYLMKLNKYAGRSFNDLSQYPVFPWVLNDYQSKTIDLKDPSKYRDLSKPIGALNPERLENLRLRMELSPEIPYLYGSFYTSAAVVIGYMIRLEPFTSLHIALQSGRFDYSSRLFISIPAAWESIASNSMDFRELTPEFFYLPDMFINSNGFDLGIAYDNVKVNHVELPAWADGSPWKFIDIHRHALESPFVTMNLHKWIDIIFGPHSRWPLSDKVDNVFHPYFFETALTPEIINDPEQLVVVKEYAVCFGTAPAKIFTDFPLQNTFKPLEIFYNPKFEQLFPFDKNYSILAISTTNQSISIVTSAPLWMIYDISAKKVQSQSLKNPQGRPASLAAIQSSICAVSYEHDTAFELYHTGNSTPFFISRAHSSKISAMAMDGNTLVTASVDLTARIWRIGQRDAQQVHIISRHSSPLSAVCISRGLDLCLTASRDGTLASTSVIKLSFVKGVSTKNTGPMKICCDKNGYITTMTNLMDKTWLETFDQNLGSCQRVCYPWWGISLHPMMWNGLSYVLVVNQQSVFVLSVPSLQVEKEFPLGTGVQTSYLDGNNRLIFVSNTDDKVCSLSL